MQSIEGLDPKDLPLADRWILARTQYAIEQATDAFEEFRLDDAAKFAFQLAWRDLADWYVEAVKPRLAAAAASPPSAAAQRAPAAPGGGASAAARSVLAYCFDVVLRLLHPVVPFITEELWQKLPGRRPDDLLAIAEWPRLSEQLYDQQASNEFLRVQEAVSAIRSIRAEYGISPKTRLQATLTAKTEDARRAFESEQDTIVRLSQLEALGFDGRKAAKAGAHAVLADGSEVFVGLSDAIDVQQECRRLSGELSRLDRQLSALSGKLANQQFVARAPAEVVAKEREKERAWRDQRQALADKLRSLGCS